jgi:hypothetical protein
VVLFNFINWAKDLSLCWMNLGSWFFAMLSSTTYSLAYISAISLNICPSTGFSSLG